MRYLVLIDKYPNNNSYTADLLSDSSTFDGAKDAIKKNILHRFTKSLEKGTFDLSTMQVQTLRDKSDEILQEISHVNNREYVKDIEVYTFNFVTTFYHIVKYSKRVTATA